ncbi:hypothetical protein [Micromonospora sp. WMMD980]|uniref:hypothetical protein n=1 Tax=Micromonospora sp. WMMD980 TaxID=3016088 RepID=UPI0024163915|nr:hypothetical protein [Micromonospora sp. WMMD980]MDG4804105.1 hypothetical protein [Micromonospora sp. WMMD980]
MPATRGHLYLPYDDNSSIQVDYVHSGSNARRTTVLVPFAVDAAWRARIEAAVRAKDPGRTDIQISNAATGEIRRVSRQPTASTPSPEPDHVVRPTAEQNNDRARNIVGNYLTGSDMYTDQHRSTLADDSRVHHPGYSEFVSQVAANDAGAPGQAFQRAAHVEGITTRGPVGERATYLNPHNHTVFAQAHENFHRIEHPSLQAPGSRLTDSTVEGMTEYLTQSATGLDFRTAGPPGQRGFTYREETRTVRDAVRGGGYSNQDVQRAYLRGSESPTERIAQVQNGGTAAIARMTSTPDAGRGGTPGARPPSGGASGPSNGQQRGGGLAK